MKARKTVPVNKVEKTDKIEVEGIVVELLPGTKFKVKLIAPEESPNKATGHTILCHLAGKMRMNYISILPGDKVKVEMSPYDLSLGRITYRFK